MPKGRNHLNTIYISERLQECLRPISQCALTTVTAPMGYGKTTAVNWYLSRQLKAEQAVQVRISIYSDNLPIFWKSVQQAFAFAGLDFLDGCECPDDVASAGFLIDTICYALRGSSVYYIFIDDFHLLTDARVQISCVIWQIVCRRMCISSQPAGDGCCQGKQCCVWVENYVRLKWRTSV